MMLLEIISGRGNSEEDCTSDRDQATYFPMQVASFLRVTSIWWKCRSKKNLVEVERVRKLACWCIQDNEFERPTMSEAVQIHRGVLEVNMPPNSKTNPSQNFELSKTVALVKRDR